MIKACHKKMDKNKAVGIDGISKEEYEANLEENIEDLKTIMPGVKIFLCFFLIFDIIVFITQDNPIYNQMRC